MSPRFQATVTLFRGPGENCLRISLEKSKLPRNKGYNASIGHPRFPEAALSVQQAFASVCLASARSRWRVILQSDREPLAGNPWYFNSAARPSNHGQLSNVRSTECISLVGVKTLTNARVMLQAARVILLFPILDCTILRKEKSL